MRPLNLADTFNIKTFALAIMINKRRRAQTESIPMVRLT